eukprot:58593-Amphidinium_carterae.1
MVWKNNKVIKRNNHVRERQQQDVKSREVRDFNHSHEVVVTRTLLVTPLYQKKGLGTESRLTLQNFVAKDMNIDARQEQT